MVEFNTETETIVSPWHPTLYILITGINDKPPEVIAKKRVYLNPNQSLRIELEEEGQKHTLIQILKC